MCESGDRLAVQPSGSSLPKIPTNILGLDEALEGGLPRERITLIRGGAGSGKTVLALECLYHWAQRGKPGLFVSFEERAENLQANAAAMAMEMAAMEQQGKLKLLHLHIPSEAIQSGEYTIKGLLALLEGHLQVLQATGLVLDALDVFLQIFNNSHREREELYLLESWIRDHRLTALLTVKRTEGERQYPFLDFLADCVLELDYRTVEQVQTRRLKIMKYRGAGYLSNEHPFVISSKGVRLMPISARSLQFPTSLENHLSTGNEHLDVILEGGFRRGSCVLLVGPSGSGKTTLVCTIIQETCRQGEAVLYVNFEDPWGQVLQDVGQVGVDLKPALETGILRILSPLPESLGTEEHFLGLMEAIEPLEPRLLVVDEISSVKRMGSEQAAFEFFLRLRLLCREQGITCVFTYHFSEPDPFPNFHTSKLAPLVDTLLSVSLGLEGKDLKRKLLVMKSRGAAHSLRVHPFTITAHGIAVEGTSPSSGWGDEKRV